MTPKCEFDIKGKDGEIPVMATTIRLESRVQAALQTLSEVTRRPMNKLVNEAVAQYVGKRSLAVERELESMAAALRAHRAVDPDDEKAIAAFVEAEALCSDSVEGKVVTRRKNRKPRGKAKERAHA